MIGKAGRRLIVAFMLTGMLPAHPKAALAPTAEQTQAGESGNDNSVDFQLRRFRDASRSLQDALAIATKLHPGARVVDASFDGQENPAVFRVKTLRGSRIFEDAIDASAGQSTGGSIESSLSEFGEEERRVLVALDAVRQEMTDAIIVAERNTEGRAISGSLQRLDGRLNFVIVTVAGDDLKQVILEPPVAKSERRQSRR